MALLDAFDTEQGRFGLGLLAMAQPSRMSDGERMLGALQMLDQFKAQRSAAEERKADREERARVRMLQEQQIQMQLEAARRQQAEAEQARLQAAERERNRSNFLGAIDAMQGPALPVTQDMLPRAMLSGFTPQEFSTLMPPKPEPLPLAKIDPKDYTPESFQQFVETRNPALLRRAAPSAPIPDPTKDLLIVGPNGTLVPNTALIDIKKQLQPPGINVSYGSLVAGVDDQGNPVFAQPSNRGGPPVIATNIKPAPSASQQKQSEASQRTQQLQAAITQARDLLQKGPTASGFGAAMDAAGRFVGASRDASQIASQLETLSGWMVANVPRMEGPQSNFDVENYKTMAAKVGDRTVPVSERMAALKTLETLQKRYADINAGVPESAPAARKATKRFNPATGRIEDITE